MAGEHLHPDGWQNQANLECGGRCRHCGWLLNGLGLMDSKRGVRVGR